MAKLQLYVAGKLNQTITSPNGAFNLDTSTLTDGQHELRVVAVNDSQAASEGYTSRNIVVNNHGQSVSIAGGNQTLSASQVAPIAVGAMPNGATIRRIELRCLGRTLGTLSGAASGLNFDWPNAEKMAATTTSDKLAVRLTGNFNVTAAQAGEFTFFFNRSNDAAQLTVDGQFVTGFDNAQWNENPEGGGSVFLSAGQHPLQVLASNIISVYADNTDYFDLALYYRGPDGVTNLADSSFLYQPVPEPTSGALLIGLSGLLLTRRRSAM